MSARIGFVLAFLAATTASAQYHGRSIDATPRITGSFGSVIFPAGTSTNMPAISRTGFGSVVFPGGGGPRLVVPGTVIDPTFAPRLGATVAGRSTLAGYGHKGRAVPIAPIYSYPVYVDGGYDPSYPYDAPYAYPPPSAPTNVTVIYPPAPAPAPIVIERPAPDSAATGADTESNFRTYQAPYNQPAPAPEEPSHYLLAFKDSTVYATVAYWVEGDTIHYFTSGNKHNRASLSMIDRDLTARLNKQAGMTVTLPAAQ